jgi:hypothetical protein
MASFRFLAALLLTLLLTSDVAAREKKPTRQQKRIEAKEKVRRRCTDRSCIAYGTNE